MKRITSVLWIERKIGMSTTWDRLTGNREPVPRLTRKRILTCFPSPPLYPLHSEFTSSERRNEPHPRILFLPVRWIHEEVAYIYIYIYGGTTVRRANCFRNGTLAGAKGSFKGKWFALSLAREPTISPSLPFLSLFIFLAPLSLLCPLNVSSSHPTFIPYTHPFNYRLLYFSRFHYLPIEIPIHLDAIRSFFF